MLDLCESLRIPSVLSQDDFSQLVCDIASEVNGVANDNLKEAVREYLEKHGVELVEQGISVYGALEIIIEKEAVGLAPNYYHATISALNMMYQRRAYTRAWNENQRDEKEEKPISYTSNRNKYH